MDGQIVRVSDVIAYVNHDIDDATRAGVIRDEDIPVALIKSLGKWPAARIDRLVEDVIQSSLKADLERIVMSEEIMAALVDLREFLFRKVYSSLFAREEVEKARKILTDLYRFVLTRPEAYIKPYPKGDSLERRAADFIAGMTDRYALSLFEKLFFPSSWS
jgi:dGTPase